MKTITTAKFSGSYRATQSAKPAFLLVLLLALPSSITFADTLAKKSPFLPPGHGAKAPEPVKPSVQPQGPISRELEFRGIVELGGVYKFSIFNKKDQKGYWLTENEALESGLSARGYDADSSSIIVNMNGRSERLTLMSATDNPMPVAQAKLPAAKPQRPLAGLPPQVANPNQTGNNTKRVIPRRRVVLPKRTN